MTRIQWERPANPRYEFGVDRGLIEMVTGNVSRTVKGWGGLVSVEETSGGDERTANYFDGVKISESVPTRNWQGVIRALQWPSDFSTALGMKTIRAGFYIMRQPRNLFNFSYRVGVGDGSYKIHIIYNASIVPNQPARKTTTETTDLDLYEFPVTAVPWKGTITSMPRHKPSAHYVVDSSKLSSAKFTAFENLLYGDPNTAGVTPGDIPSPQVIFDLLNAV